MPRFVGRRATRALGAVALALTIASLALPISPSAALAPGVYISGPEAIAFNTQYRYQVTVLTNRSYKPAAVYFTTLGCSHKLFVNLTAHRPWRRSFPMIFTADNFRNEAAISAAVVSSPTKKSYAQLLFHTSSPLTALPDATPATEPPPYSYPFCDAPGAD